MSYSPFLNGERLKVEFIAVLLGVVLSLQAIIFVVRAEELAWKVITGLGLLY